ncbi:hypothetical protein RRG08_025102 [Elysia crispata]|uniref:Uncharacterized protein n=1 Tax=Elysia crispata TaxID=231223 RepID=A0AAE1AIN2_9GAST|nr:hypothetical protein RRG08_025102 [Elysia crispata]
MIKSKVTTFICVAKTDSTILAGLTPYSSKTIHVLETNICFKENETLAAESRSIGRARRKLGSPKQRHGEENVQVQTLAMLKYMCYKVNIGGYLIELDLVSPVDGWLYGVDLALGCEPQAATSESAILALDHEVTRKLAVAGCELNVTGSPALLVSSTKGNQQVNTRCSPVRRGTPQMYGVVSIRVNMVSLTRGGQANPPHSDSTMEGLCPL